jgi:Flp pilus assembly protein TadG
MRKQRPWLRRLLAPMIGVRRGFARDEKGAVAVEFALLALPFFGIIFAILETSIVFFAGQILDSAVQDASRKVRTGQAQQITATHPLGWDSEDFRDAVCEGLYTMFDCTQLWISVEVVPNFTTVQVTSPVSDDCVAGIIEEDEEDVDCVWTLEEEFLPGGGSQTVVVQAHYKWPTMINLPGVNFATLGDGTRLLSAVRVFKNEPF